MQNLLNSLAVLAFLGTVLLFFAFAALLRTVRELQSALVRAQSGAPAPNTPRSVARFKSDDGRPTFVLVVSENCANCIDRTRHLVETAGTSPLGHVLVLCGGACADWVAGSPVKALTDSDLLGSIGIGATPSLIRYEADGTEQWRRVIGADEDLDDLLGLNTLTTAPPTPAPTEVDA
ncbi:hypothetical protein AB0P21_08870 [Kribbella sp. NPDC056861]|uniref:hypothetical protein n=1 Tax=Kribbella sp. NPDC056861 TaxID=3154857 RepID=UPI003423796E